MMSPPDSVNLKPRVVNFNIMVAGLSGLGKTTFCKALLDSWMESADESSTESMKNKKKNGEGGGINAQTMSVRESSPLEWYDDTANTLLRVRIIDTPGFGNKVNHHNSVQVIRKYIQSCRKKQMQQEMSSQPSLSFRDKQEERLVHVCLYFLSPGRFLEIDRHFLKIVQHEVPIVPIIAKADTLTDDEISEYRALLKKTLEKEQIQVYDFDSIEMDGWEPKTFAPNFFGRGKGKEKSNATGTKSFLDTDRSDARLIRAVLKKTTLQNRNYRGRKKSEALAIIARDGIYPWGEAVSQDPHHSDLRLIRDLLLSEHTERFLEQSQMQYQQYRTNSIARGKVVGGLRQSALVFLVALQLATTFKLDQRMRKVFSHATNLLLSLRTRDYKRDKEIQLPIEVEATDDTLILLEETPSAEEKPSVEESETGRTRGIFGLFGTPSYDHSVGQPR
ncbi:unnamed protein product [Cylindrotheca closterium]|uniref:Septin-type G domain-containing protein n=1 Tax=Cylindrotheca closterium TaxID=2856 RepID=A0AAD2CQM2_9STRA|nr:unnamed protein product [Cylindrotheca closterium]